MRIKGLESIEEAFATIDVAFFDVDEEKVDAMSIEHLEKYIQEFDEEYKRVVNLTQQIHTFLNDKNVSGPRKEELLENNNTYISKTNRLYKDNRRILSLSYQLKKTNKKLENSLGLQFGIFSAVLSVLSFVLNNSKLLSYDSIDFRNVLLINLSHILACAVMFYFAMWFIKPYKHSKGRVWTLTLIIIAICVLIYLVASRIITV